jgi:hypothetical protein
MSGGWRDSGGIDWLCDVISHICSLRDCVSTKVRSVVFSSSISSTLLWPEGMPVGISDSVDRDLLPNTRPDSFVLHSTLFRAQRTSGLVFDKGDLRANSLASDFSESDSVIEMRKVNSSLNSLTFLYASSKKRTIARVLVDREWQGGRCW